MGTMASQITSLTIVFSTTYSGAYKKKSKLRVTGLCVGEFTGDWWILRTNGQYRKKFHLMTSSCFIIVPPTGLASLDASTGRVTVMTLCLLMFFFIISFVIRVIRVWSSTAAIHHDTSLIPIDIDIYSWIATHILRLFRSRGSISTTCISSCLRHVKYLIRFYVSETKCRTYFNDIKNNSPKIGFY